MRSDVVILLLARNTNSIIINVTYSKIVRKKHLVTNPKMLGERQNILTNLC